MTTTEQCILTTTVQHIRSLCDVGAFGTSEIILRATEYDIPTDLHYNAMLRTLQTFFSYFVNLPVSAVSLSSASRSQLINKGLPHIMTRQPSWSTDLLQPVHQEEDLPSLRRPVHSRHSRIFIHRRLPSSTSYMACPLPFEFANSENILPYRNRHGHNSDTSFASFNSSNSW